jgi:sugar-specific transcriptional regulator TrmB
MKRRKMKAISWLLWLFLLFCMLETRIEFERELVETEKRITELEAQIQTFYSVQKTLVARDEILRSRVRDVLESSRVSYPAYRATVIQQLADVQRELAEIVGGAGF